MGTRATNLRKRFLGVVALAATAAVMAAVPANAAASEGTIELGGKECRLIGVPTAAPVGFGGCTGVRPGALVETRSGFCTLNFMFRDRSGDRYIGTAGHCIVGEGREREWRRGPVARDSRGRAIGRFRYAVLRGEKDFALIELNRRASRRSTPRMCHFGGPTGIDASRPRHLVSLSHYGNGLGTGATTPARTFVARGMRNRHHVFADGVASLGDSGGPVTRRGNNRAVGLVVSVGVHFGSFADNGLVGITRIPPQKQRAQRVTGERFRLLTARPR